ncbi:MAG: cobalamin B12-binding domain-containing protein [bacterium]|nr:cobalamin B12-binding domain-containing protein [bacterium]
MKKSQYSIKDLENLTDIKAHTIRIWEQRYGLLSPKRTDTNIRYYEDQDLKKLLNVNLLYTKGYKISKIAALTDEEIIEKSKEIIVNERKWDDDEVDVLLMGIIELDEHKIQNILGRIYDEHGIEHLFSRTITPLLIKMGELWQLNSLSVGHEHFFSNIYRGFVLSKIAALEPPKKLDKKILMFLPPNEEHELSLLVYQYMFKREGWQVYYLGISVPFEDLKISYDQIKPDLTLTSLIAKSSEKEFESLIKGIQKTIPPKELVLSGGMSSLYKEKLAPGVRLIESEKDLKALFV